MFWIVVTLFLVTDVIVMAVVFKRLRQKGALGNLGDVVSAAKFARAAHEEVGAYLRANYGGDTDSLPRVMQGLVDELETRARGEGLALDRDMIKRLAAQSVTAHKAAKAADIRTALATVS